MKCQELKDRKSKEKASLGHSFVTITLPFLRITNEAKSEE